MTKIKISAQDVKELRSETGASIMECKNALADCNGNFDKAIENLRRSGKEKAIKKAGRATGEGLIGSYIHSNKRIGAMVEVFCETDFVAKNAEFQELAHNLAMHIAASDPKYLSVEKIDPSDLQGYEKIVHDDFANQNKPEEILKKMISGKVKKHFEEISLLSQPFVKDPDITVDDLIRENIAKIGENIRIGDFQRFEI